MTDDTGRGDMSESKRKSASVTEIWKIVEIDSDRARVSTVNGMGKIRFECGIEITIPGKNYDADSVVRAHLEQQKLLKKALKNQPDSSGLSSWESPEGAEIAATLGLPDDAEPPNRNMPECFEPSAEDELGELVEDLGDNGKD